VLGLIKSDESPILFYFFSCAGSTMSSLLKNMDAGCLLLLSAVMLTLAGCGSSDRIAEPEPTRQRQGESTTMRAPELKPATVQPKKVKKKQPVAPVGDPEDLFEVVDYVHNYQIRKPDANPVSDDEFVMLSPAGPGVNSSTFSVTQPETSGEPEKSNVSFKLPEGFSVIEEAGYSAEGLPRRIRCERDYSEMVLVPAGVSLQGVTEGNKNAQPRFSVFQKAFYIDVNEVTLEQYRRWRSEMIAKKGRVPEPAGNDAQAANFPAMGIAYSDAIHYARSMGKQLPLETQWEKAARGERGSHYPWGNGRALWHQNRYPGQIDPVKSYPGDLSPYCVYDLAGNAREWCDDWYSPNAYQAALTVANDGVVRDWQGPKRPVVPGQRVVRGGKDSWKVWKRAGENMRTPPADVGFRCVLNLSVSPEERQQNSRPGNAF